jgi:hypothetical protein
MPCSDHAVILKATAQHGRLSTAVLCCGLEKKGMVGAWHRHGMASVNHTRPHCVNQIGKTHFKPLAARHGRGMAWVRHGHGVLCVNRPSVVGMTIVESSHRLSRDTWTYNHANTTDTHCIIFRTIYLLVKHPECRKYLRRGGYMTVNKISLILYTA